MEIMVKQVLSSVAVVALLLCGFRGRRGRDDSRRGARRQRCSDRRHSGRRARRGHAPGGGRRNRSRWPLRSAGALDRDLSGQRHARGLFGGRPDRDHRKRRGGARRAADAGRGHGHLGGRRHRIARRARDEADPAARRHHHEGGHRADQPDLQRRRVDDGRQHYAGGERPVRRAPATARPGFDAAAGPRRRRAPQHRAAGDRSHGCGSRPGLARRHQPHGSRERRGDADVWLRRAGRHHQHHHQRSNLLARRPVALRVQRLLQLERERRPRHRHGRVHVAAFHGARPGGRGGLRGLHGRGPRRRGHTAPARVRRPPSGRHDRRQLRLRLQRVSGALQRALRAHRQRGAQLAGARQLRERVEPDQAG